jgi:hypothetical protein
VLVEQAKENNRAESVVFLGLNTTIKFDRAFILKLQKKACAFKMEAHYIRTIQRESRFSLYWATF